MDDKPNVKAIIGVRFEQQQAVALLQSQQKLATVADDLVEAIIELQHAVSNARIELDGDMA